MSPSAQRPLAVVADDDSIVRLTLSATLQDAGFDVEVVSDGAQAVAAFERVAPSLVILDVIMPEMDGFEVCASIRSKPGGKYIPILMLTGQDATKPIDHAFEVGATDFITKPVNFSLLKHRLRYLIRTAETVEELRDQQMHLDSAQRLAKIGSWDWDLQKKRLRVSGAAYTILGLNRRETFGHYEDLLQSVHPDDHASVSESLRRAVEGLGPLNLEHRVVLANGRERIIQQEALFTTDENSSPKLIGTALDVTERKDAERRIVDLAYYDELTQLPNRTFLMEHLNYVLTQLARSRRIGAVLSLDLDRFKQVNDAFGHAAGDTLLRLVAERLSSSLRKSDCVVRRTSAGAIPSDDDVTVARFGGDEFIILLSEIQSPEDSGLVAGRILGLFSDAFDLDGKEVFVTPSIGIALYPNNGDNADTLLDHADAAMYKAKEQGAAYRFYSDSISSTARQRLLMSSRLRAAIRDESLSVYYQPKLRVDGPAVVGFEALTRWTDPELGVVSPAEFIPVAEETGLIVTMGAWVIRSVCEQIAAWKQEGFPLVPVAVNVSARQLRGDGLVEHIETTLAATGVEPACLEIEITEGVLIEEARTSGDILNRLRELGIRIALDDFGTGYSSLSYLKRFPIGTVKIDQSFVRDVTTNPDSAAIVHAIIALSESLHLDVVAEGVETEEHLNFLREHGCSQVQGYLFSPPLPPDKLRQWIVSTQRIEQTA